MSVITIIAYLSITLYTWFFSNVSQMSKMIGVVEIVSYFLASIIIVNCVYTRAIVLVAIVPILKNIAYMYIRIEFVRE